MKEGQTKKCIRNDRRDEERRIKTKKHIRIDRIEDERRRKQRNT